ncbi:MAG: hypothetical protein JWR43_2463 [Phenylobacterium sp.]|nr:hypothetical protein [Phenylobacterium sp.]
MASISYAALRNGGGQREGLRLEAVLKVALDILAAAAP